MRPDERQLTPDWRRWRDFFEARPLHALPDPFSADPALADVSTSVARSLAIFQLGESGGGSVVEQARRSRLPGIDADYARALERFVAEEHRHAELLACAVRMLGGELIRRNWTARLFVAGRRLLGLRLKVAVLLAAEVVGICYYELLASRLPPGRLRLLLRTIARDEIAHLDFHCTFLRTQTRSPWRRRLFRLAWRTLSLAAGCVVLIDHRQALRDLGLPPRVVLRRFLACARQAETLVVTDPRDTGCGDVPAADGRLSS